MNSSKVLKDTVRRAQREVKKLLAEVRDEKPNKSKLVTGLKEVQNELKVLDIHAHRFDAK
jgi:hypothetical protein